MEVVATEEKKKIFRARKTMKISDRQQLETLHNTLLTTSTGLSESPSPPLMNGTHKEDGQKVTDKEQNVSDSNSPDAPSPSSSSSSTPFLSLNLSPSPGSSPSPKGKEETTTPTSPFHSINFEHKKMDNDEEEVKTGSLSPSSKELITQAAKDSKENQERDTQMVTAMEKKAVEKTTADNPAEDTVKDSIEGLAPSSPVSISVSESTEPMETDSNTAKAKDLEATTVQTGDEKPTPKSTTPQTASSSATVLKQKTEIKEEDMKEEAVETKDVNKDLVKEEKLDLSSVKSETKKGKTKVGQHTKQSRPSSTPPSNTVPEEKSSTSGLKRTLSEGFEKEGQTVKRDGKRPKMEREELEAQLELKITAKAGSHHKLENIVQQLVEERLRVVQLTIFDKNFQELKDRVEKIDCATKHQTAINTLQIKIARLSKKFGEANQASENKRKQEALAAAAAAATAAAATAKTATVANSPQAQRVLRRQAVELQPEVPREGMVPSVGETPAQSMKKEEEDEERDISPHTTMAKKLAEYNEGKCRADIKLRTITSHLEKVLYRNCQRRSGRPRSDRYASFIFRYLVPYDVYCEWVTKVNYVGLLGKEALPTNLRRTMRMYIEYRFPKLSCDSWREIRDVINELLRVKRRPEFFRCTEDRTAVALW